MTTAVLRSFALLLGLLGGAATAVHAADEPDLIFKRSTVFKWVSPNDKLATYGLDDPEVDGVACHFTVPEKGGFKGWLGLAEEVSDISLACRQIGPIRFKAKFEQGDDMFRQAPLAVLQEDADRARLRHQAECAGLYGLFRPDYRRLAEEFDLVGADHAVGQRRPNSALCRICRITAPGVNFLRSTQRRTTRLAQSGLHAPSLCISSGRIYGEANMKSDRDLALSAAEQGFMDSVEHLFSGSAKRLDGKHRRQSGPSHGSLRGRTQSGEENTRHGPGQYRQNLSIVCADQPGATAISCAFSAQTIVRELISERQLTRSAFQCEARDWWFP